MPIALKSHVNSLGLWKCFWEVFLFKMGQPKLFCMFSSKSVVLKKNFRIFNICCLFWVKNWKILAISKTLFFKTKTFFLQKTFLVVKNRVLGKGQNFKIFQFFIQNISETTKLMLKTFLKFFSEIQIYSKTCKTILDDPPWIKIPLKKIPRREKAFTPESLRAIEEQLT